VKYLSHSKYLDSYLKKNYYTEDNLHFFLCLNFVGFTLSVLCYFIYEKKYLSIGEALGQKQEGVRLDPHPSHHQGL